MAHVAGGLPLSDHLRHAPCENLSSVRFGGLNFAVPASQDFGSDAIKPKSHKAIHKRYSGRGV